MIDIVKIFIPSLFSFAIGLAITPFVWTFLVEHKFWKKKRVLAATDGRTASITQALRGEEEQRTPLMGGVVIWGSAFIAIGIFWLASFADGDILTKLSFFSRNQTWLPFFTLMVGALIGLLDDYWSVNEVEDQKAGGISFKKRMFMVAVVALIGAWWFYTKLEVTSIMIPFHGMWNVGLFFVPFFIIVMLGTYSGGVIDGLDGLSGGIFATIFSAYGFIAFIQNQIDLAAFCFVLVGAILAFLWHNIPPAKFYMAETGTMALTMTLAVVAFLTQQVILLPIIAFPLVLSSASSQIQLLSKKLRGGKKVFRVAPLHHHFQALGWPASTVVMRYWIIGVMSAILGLVLFLLG